jgi:hypothetical protein
MAKLLRLSVQFQHANIIASLMSRNRNSIIPMITKRKEVIIVIVMCGSVERGMVLVMLLYT